LALGAANSLSGIALRQLLDEYDSLNDKVNNDAVTSLSSIFLGK